MPATAAAAAATCALCRRPSLSLQAVLVPSEQLPEDAPTIRGHDFNEGRDLDAVMGAMLRTGLQATALGQAVEEVNRMVGAGGGGKGPVRQQSMCAHQQASAALRRPPSRE